jgi:hypothetical protein
MKHWGENIGKISRRTGGVTEVDHAILLCMLKLLERSVRLGENLELFGDVLHREVTVKVAATVKGKKTKLKKKVDRSKSPQDHVEDKASIGAESKQDGKDRGAEVELEEEL